MNQLAQVKPEIVRKAGARSGWVSARAVPVAARAVGDPPKGGSPRAGQAQGLGLTGVIEYSVRSSGVKSRRAMEQARLSQAATVAGQAVTRPVGSRPRTSLPSGVYAANTPSSGST